jgi:hypothetical protein
MNEFRSRWDYVSGDFGRPNFMTFSNNQGRYFYENPNDLNSTKLWLPEGQENVDWIIVSDHNRSSAPFNVDRLGTNKRMINGKLRTYHIADKLNLQVSWKDLPSRAYSTLEGYPDWKAYEDSKNSASPLEPVVKFTVDGGAGGVELLKWYQGHHGSFWVFFSFDAVPVPLPSNIVFQGYGRVYEMIMTEFDYDMTKRSQGFQCGLDMLYLDLWDVSMTLEEV